MRSTSSINWDVPKFVEAAFLNCQHELIVAQLSLEMCEAQDKGRFAPDEVFQGIEFATATFAVKEIADLGSHPRVRFDQGDTQGSVNP